MMEFWKFAPATQGTRPFIDFSEGYGFPNPFISRPPAMNARRFQRRCLRSPTEINASLTPARCDHQWRHILRTRNGVHNYR